jgi:hypothetical protein
MMVESELPRELEAGTRIYASRSCTGYSNIGLAVVGSLKLLNLAMVLKLLLLLLLLLFEWMLLVGFDLPGDFGERLQSSPVALVHHGQVYWRAIGLDLAVLGATLGGMIDAVKGQARVDPVVL